MRTVLKAAGFAAEKHSSQKRKGVAEEPYLNHLIEVAELLSLACAESDPDLIAAAFLHDTLEDTKTTRQELIETFGSDITGLVCEVTDDKSLPKVDRKRLQIEHAPHLTERAQLLKIADKISNLRAILLSPPANWDLARKQEYAAWAKLVVDACIVPNSFLRTEFERTLARVRETFRTD